MFAYGPIAQPPGYHAFADARSMLGVPNFCNVSSNAAFLLAGLAGLVILARGRVPGVLPQLRWVYCVLCVATILVGIGSAHYHLRPDNASLVWDRAPMAVAFSAFFAIVIGEHIGWRWGTRLVGPLAAIGLATVWYWQFTEKLGRGDLRWYVLVQALPLVLSPLILVLFPGDRERDRLVWPVLAGYVLAKVFEILDWPIMDWTGVVSGHSLKHIAAACAICFLIVAMRRPLGDLSAQPAAENQ